jgi:hypothetical protein
MRGSADARRVPSRLWKAVAVTVAVAGIIATLIVFSAALGVIAAIDPAAVSGHGSVAQAMTEVTTTVIGFGGLGGSLFSATRLWQRPAMVISAEGVMVCNRRPVLVPWPMISGVTTAQSGTGNKLPALVLIDGELLVCGFAPRVLPDRGGRPETAGSSGAMKLIGEAIAGQRSASGAGHSHQDVAPHRLERGSLFRRRLPGQGAYEIPRTRLPQKWLVLLGAPIMELAMWPRMEVLGGQTLNSADLLVALAATAGGVGLIVAVQWWRHNRKVIIGDVWIAWRPRVRLGWHVLEFRQVVSVAPGHGQGGIVAVKLADGHGIKLGDDELKAGGAAALLRALDGNPALTDTGRERLHQAASAQWRPGHRGPYSARHAGAAAPAFRTAPHAPHPVRTPPPPVPPEPAEGPPASLAARTSVSYRANYAWPAWFAAGAFQVALVTMLIATGNPASAHGLAAGFLNRAGGAVAAMLSGLVFYQLGRCRISAGPSGLIIEQWITRHELPWSTVEDVAINAGGGMQVMVRGRAPISVDAFGGSLIGGFTGGIRAREARDGIREVWSSAQSTDVAPLTQRSFADIRWTVPAVAGVLTLVAALSGALIH